MSTVKPKTCADCVGYTWGNCAGFSRVTGEGRIPLLIVGEASGGKEELRGEPFVGASGQLLNRALGMAGLQRKDYWVTNVIRCRPPGNLLKGMAYERAAIDHCKQYLDQVVEERQPKFILALGDIALRELSTTSGSISELRGFVLESRYGIPMLAAYHPAFLMPRKGQAGAMHLFGVLMHDIRRSVQFSTKGVPAKTPTNYVTSPTPSDVRTYLERLQDSELAVAYDIETAGILGEDESSVWAEKRIVQIQFSSGIGEALVLPWEGEWIEAAQAILATSNRKLDWFGRLFDRKVLRSQGITINGETHDLIDAWQHLQPSFTSAKDDAHGDKGVPSKLMGLQSCVSFYYPEEGVWKGTVDPSCPYEEGPERGEWFTTRVWPTLRYYGARDADLTYRVGLKLFAALNKLGLYDGYYQGKHRLSTVLDDLSARGLPVDSEKQAELSQYITAEEARLSTELQILVPDELKPLSKKDGYKGFPKDLREAVKASGEWKPKTHPLDYVTTAASLGYIVKIFELETSEGEAFSEKRLVKLLPFNSNSSDQLLAYIRHRGYRVPTHIDTGRDTTGKDALDRLVKETDDAVLKMTRQMRKLSKLKGVYAGGDWTPGIDGRVHADFRFGSASGQTSATHPNVQQFVQHYDPAVQWEVDVVRRCKAMIRAEGGHKIVKTDMRGFHSRAIAHLAEDPLYYRMSLHDVHSAVCAHFLNLPHAGRLMEMQDDELDDYLGHIKKEHKYTRDFKVKRAVHGMQFLLQAPKLYDMNPDAFENVVEAAFLMDTIRDMFPITFRDFPKKIEKMLRNSPCIVSPFGHRRLFWDLDEQQATAFLPSNCSHATIQSAMVRLYDQGAFEKYSAVNFLHDAVWWMPHNSEVDECIVEAKKELERPSDVLVNKTLGAFWCPADAEVGDDLNSCKAYSVVQ